MRYKGEEKNGVISMVILLFIFVYIFYISSSRVEPVVYGFFLGDEWKLISEWKIGSKAVF